MPASTTIKNNKKRRVDLTVLDVDGQPFVAVPEGASVSHISSDTSIVTVSPIEGAPFSYYAGSGLVGTGNVTSTLSVPGSPDFTDALAVAIVNSDVASFGFAVGAEEDEAPTP